MSDAVPSARPRRGRPPKFGRPAQLVTLTLPDDVVERLRQMGPDLGWAIVKLCERASRSGRRKPNPPLADLVQLPNRRALILVRPDIFRSVAGVAVIPLADGRGFLALEPGRGAAELEIAVLDRLETAGLAEDEREGLQAVRGILRQWRHQGIRFHARSIIVAERSPEGFTPEPLVELQSPADA